MTDPRTLIEGAIADAGLPGPEAREDFWTREVTGASGEITDYIRYSTDVALNEKVVFYETMSGDRMNDSPFAMFEYLRSHPEYGSFLHVWSINDPSTIPEQYRNQADVVFTRRGTLSYAYFLACAGNVICNTTLPMFFCRRNGQKYLNTWHGIPYKALGRDMPRAKFGGSTAAAANLVKATHVISPCAYMTEALASAYSMIGVSGALVGETGYPRIDLTLNVDAERQTHLRKSIGVDHRRPVVLYAPTWRIRSGETAVDSGRIIQDLNALAALDIQLLYRGHHRIANLIEDRTIGEGNARIIVPPLDITSNELLAVVDILITDYSSIFFDFLPTGRPIIHYLHDLEEYAATQGLYLDTEELPGAVVTRDDDLVDAVRHEAAALRDRATHLDTTSRPLQGAKYAEAQKRFLPHEDGNSSRRAVEFFFNGRVSGIELTSLLDDRPSLAYWAGPLDNSLETEGFLELASRQGDSQEYQTALVFENKSHVGKEALKAMKSIRSQNATITCRSEPPVLLPAEKETYAEFVNRDDLGFTEVVEALQENETLKAIFEREYRRQLDEKRFDVVHLMPDLNNHELALVALAVEGLHDAKVVQHEAPQLQLIAVTARLEASQDRVERLREQVERLRERSERQKKVNASLKSQLGQMKNTISWRITKPLRAVKLLKRPGEEQRHV